jgi:hypothetical protein
VTYAVERLCDLRRCNPFEAAVEPALWVLRRDRAMGATLPAERWILRTGARRAEGAREFRAEVAPEQDYSPVESHRPEGPWAPGSARREATRGLEGRFGWEIRHGLKHDCNGVYLLELEQPAEAESSGVPEEVPLLRVRNRPRTSRRIRVAPWSGLLEPTYVRPLLQSRHLQPFTIAGWGHVLAPVEDGKVVNEARLRHRAPRTWQYLARHRDPLAARRSRVFGSPPFYRLFGVGPYNQAGALVVWSGMGFRPWFVPVDRVPDPWLGPSRPLMDSSCYLVPVGDLQEACYLAGLLNSGPVQDFLESRSSGSKRGLSRAVMSRLRLPPWEPDRRAHQRLASAVTKLTRVGPRAEAPTARERQEAEGLARRILAH